MCFALAKAYEDIFDTKKQFKYLDEGSKLKKEELKYDFNQSAKLLQSLTDLFKTNEKVDISTRFLSKIRPIFIVGMPRSGTSLVEQIISSHPKVNGLGEL